MAKPSPAKVKMLASQAKKAAAARRSQQNAEPAKRMSSDPQDDYFEQDENWRAIGLAAPARRALVDEGFYQLSDLRKISIATVKDLHGIGPNAVRILVAEMKKHDLSFRS